MSDNTDYEQTGEQLDQKFADLESQIEEIANSSGDGGTSEGIITLDVQQLAAALLPKLDYEAITEQVAGRIDTSGGSFPEEELEKLRRARQRAELAAGGNHVRTIETGLHEDDGYHPYGAWGLIVTVTEPVQWRSATIHAESGGDVLLEIYEMDYTAGETYVPGDRIASNQLQVDGGQQTIPIEITLSPGTYFITRDTETPTADDLVSMKRVAEGVDWGSLNDSHEIPITLEETWQLGRKPGTEDFDYYKSQGWDQTLHYWANPEFGCLELDSEG